MARSLRRGESRAAPDRPAATGANRGRRWKSLAYTERCFTIAARDIRFRGMNNPSWKEFSASLREARTRRGLSLDQASIALKVAENQILLWEERPYHVPLRSLAQMARVYGLELEVLQRVCNSNCG